MKRKLIVLSAAIVVVLAGCKKDLQQGGSTTTTSSADMRAPSGQMMPNEILVKFKDGFSESKKMNALLKISGKVSEKIYTKTMERFGNKEGIYLVHTPLTALEAISKMKGSAEVAYAEPNYIYQHDAVSNDTYYTNGSLWGMMGNFGSSADAAWKNGHTGSKSVFVGVIDEGAMFNHTDLNGNFWTNTFDPVDGKDNDNNGYVDDVHGWDFADNDNTTFDGTADDHGTHVSGTIGAKGGNGTGVAGVNWAVTIISAKFLGNRGGTTANAIKAVDYITDLKARHGLNIVATNNSWGGGGFSQGLEDAIERANAGDILFVAAAGNDGNNIDATASYPAGYPNANIISVAAIDVNGNLASWSNYGKTTVDIGAPGVNIYSTLPAKQGKNIASSYGSYSGTSMATPHVTGAAALYASTHSGATAAQIKSAILSSAILTSSLSGKCVTGGRLNVSGF